VFCMTAATRLQIPESRATRARPNGAPCVPAGWRPVSVLRRELPRAEVVGVPTCERGRSPMSAIAGDNCHKWGYCCGNDISKKTRAKLQ